MLLSVYELLDLLHVYIYLIGQTHGKVYWQQVDP